VFAAITASVTVDPDDGRLATATGDRPVFRSARAANCATVAVIVGRLREEPISPQLPLDEQVVDRGGHAEGEHHAIHIDGRDIPALGAAYEGEQGHQAVGGSSVS
jgi:hypothetical protein